MSYERDFSLFFHCRAIQNEDYLELCNFLLTVGIRTQQRAGATLGCSEGSSGILAQPLHPGLHPQGAAPGKQQRQDPGRDAGRGSLQLWRPGGPSAPLLPGLQSSLASSCCQVQRDERLRPEPGRCDAEMGDGTETFLVSDAPTFHPVPEQGHLG